MSTGQAATVAGAVARHQDAPRANTSRNTLETLAEWVTGAGARRLLDAPCGEGALLDLLRGRVPELTGGDVQPELLRVPGVSCLRLDLQDRWSVEDGAFDAVVCADGIEHIENPFHLVREAWRALEPGGRLYVSTPNINAIRSRWRFLWSGFHNKFKHPLDESRRDPLHHVNPIGLPELRYILHTSGFRIERVGTNRIKFQSWPYAVLYPIAAVYTALAFRQEHTPDARRRNAEVRAQMLSPAVFLGETLIVQARKQG